MVTSTISNVGVQDGVCGRLLPPEQAGVWGEALVELSRRPDLVSAWAEAAPREASRFSLKRSATEVQDLYDRLLGSNEAIEGLREAA